MVDKKRNSLKQYDTSKILSAMSDVRTALDVKADGVKSKKNSEKELPLILEDVFDDKVLLLDDVVHVTKKQKNINDLDLRNTISELIKPDIELWIDENINTILQQYVKKILRNTNAIVQRRAQ
ncbi:MAG: hypothetical protein CFH32_00749 [Alphaproteobacteria bacterium MarineAlpha9_Bin2]|nr:MAG: hypothetical protein CFH31_00531 [Alphaproteobacteria bacterium MarineAlpha9_Bin1]PPR30388.1 MAG: hypothetical protein CFH32_00749 [Alphaproteobacteria bacterium MarineAlpha9_Bin2]